VGIRGSNSEEGGGQRVFREKDKTWKPGDAIEKGVSGTRGSVFAYLATVRSVRHL